MKKTLSLVLGILLVLSAATASAQINLQICQTAAEGSPWVDMSYRMAELVKEYSGGSVTADVYPSGQMGSQTDIYDQALAGATVIGVATPAYLADMGVPDFGILSGPYLCTNWDEIDKLTSSEWFANMCAQMEAKGLKILPVNIEHGQRHTLSTNALNSLADYAGAKIRVPNATVYIKTYTSLGAAPVPMNLGEVYTSLAQGVIEGEDNTIATMASEKHYEVAKYLVMDSHIYDVQFFVMSADVFNSLTAQEQDALLKATQEAVSWFNQAIIDNEQLIIDDMIKEGVTVIDTLDLNEFVAAAASFYTDPEVCGAWTEGLYENVRGIIQG